MGKVTTARNSEDHKGHQGFSEDPAFLGFTHWTHLDTPSIPSSFSCLLDDLVGWRKAYYTPLAAFHDTSWITPDTPSPPDQGTPLLSSTPEDTTWCAPCTSLHGKLKQSGVQWSPWFCNQHLGALLFSLDSHGLLGLASIPPSISSVPPTPTPTPDCYKQEISGRQTCEFQLPNSLNCGWSLPSSA